MSLSSAYLQNLIDELSKVDTDKSNIGQRLQGNDFDGGKGDAVLALLLAVAGGIPVTPAPPTVIATSNKGTTSPTPSGVGALLVGFSKDFTGTFDGLTVDVTQTPSLSFNLPGKLVPAYAIVATTGSFWWETLT
jgi:hypothetical protein